MAYQVRVASDVAEDLQDISDYLLPRNEYAAFDITEALIAAYQSLSDFPYKGRLRDDLLPGLRNLVVGNYLIFYRVEADVVFVDRILHGARNLSAIFGASDVGRN